LEDLVGRSDHLRADIDRNIILKCIFGYENVIEIEIFQFRGQWRAFIITGMNLR
jgi:hypothetical protein